MNPAGDHRRYQSLLAAYVLDPDSLTSDESRELNSHLEGCAECRREEAELRSVVVSLGAASPNTGSMAPDPSLEDWVVAAVVEDQGQERPEAVRENRTGWRLRNFFTRPKLGVPALAVAAAFVFVLVAVVFPFFSEGDGPPGLGETEQIAFTGAPNDVSTDAVVVAHTWGTELDIKVEGLKPGEVYAVNIESRNGGSEEAGTFVAVPDKAVDCQMNGAVLRQDARAILVTNSDGDVVMRADLERAPDLAYST